MEITAKFWLIRYFEEALSKLGLPQGITDLVTFAAALAILAGVVWIIDYLGSRIVLRIIHTGIHKTETKWDDFLLERKFFSRLLRIMPLLVVEYFLYPILAGYDPAIIAAAQMILKSIIIVLILLVISAFLDAANDIYDSRPAAHEASIKGYIQTAKIVIYVIGIILIFSLLIGKNPRELLVGLGASAAILTLVFKDTILGFVASIQLSAQDMVRKGDWIEIPSKNTDGVVTDINVNSVKVKNWNNTVTMVPIYSLVSEPFTNWRNMEEGDGRRFKRPLNVDITCIRALTCSEIETISENPYIKPVADKMKEFLGKTNTSAFATNIGLYRSYIEAYLFAHPKVNHNLLLLVRYTATTEYGITIEVYAFSTEKDLLPYEKVVSDIFENIIAVAPLFHIQLYQAPAGYDITALRANHPTV